MSTFSLQISGRGSIGSEDSDAEPVVQAFGSVP